jgi:hypothetical protein
MFCAPGLIFGSTEGFGSCFDVLHTRTSFRRYRGCRVLLTSFACPDSFSSVPMALGPIFMFCAPGLVFGGTEGFGSRFYVFHAQTCFRRNRGRLVPFLYFLHLDSYLAVLRASDSVFMLWRTHSFSAVPRSSGPVLKFCVPGLVFDGTEGIKSRFQVLRSQTRFRWYGGCRVPI